MGCTDTRRLLVRLLRLLLLSSRIPLLRLGLRGAPARVSRRKQRFSLSLAPGDLLRGTVGVYVYTQWSKWLLLGPPVFLVLRPRLQAC